MIMISDNADEFKKLESDAIVRTLEFFSMDTPLREAEKYGGRPYERRVQQDQMAHAVADSLEKNKNLCIEAPTGVGKSFAYLVPAIYHAVALKQCVLITTETINLQEQLVLKDLPLLRSLMNLNFTYVIAKGRANYLCKRRLSLARGEHRAEFLPGDALMPDIEKIAEWSLSTQDGSRSDIQFRMESQTWPCVCSEATNCGGKKCNYYNSCFYWRARHQWDKADIVVTNHALFFVDLKIRALEEQDSTPLPAYCSVIFDEAHTLEDNAANHLGLHVTSSAFRFFLNRLFNPSNRRGLLMKPGDASLEIQALISRIHESATHFFEQFEKDIMLSPDKCFRILKKGFYIDELSEHLEKLENILRYYTEEQDDAEFKTELRSNMEKCRAYREEISAFVQMLYDEHVYWTEGRNSQYSHNQIVELSAAPLNVAKLLQAILFLGDMPVILTSATLAVKGRLDYYMKRVGFQNGNGMILDSPFDYTKQIKLYLSRKMPFPHEKNYNEEASKMISHFVNMTDGKAFVLFTNYSMLRYCAENLSSEFRLKGINLLVHGESFTRSAMLNEFKRNENSVIFGATSFWTGVDVPGNALSNVIITKLPFAVPNHPLIQARCERIRHEGGEPFSDYSLPDAVLKFRQGIGRLIRSKTDTGIIVVLDPRIVAKYYGKMFLNSIPQCPVIYF